MVTKKKIAYIGIKGIPSKAGADRVVEALVQNLDKSRFDPVVYCSNKMVPKGTSIPGLRLILIPTVRGKYLHALLLFTLSAFHALFFGGYDLVHTHNIEVSFILPLLKLRYTILSTSHGAPQGLGKWGPFAQRLIRLTEKFFVMFPDANTCVSQWLQEYYQKKYNKQVRYIPNGVESLSHYSGLDGPPETLRSLGISPGSYLLFGAGRMVPSKGCHLLLEAFKKIDTPLSLLVVGDLSQVPAYSEELKNIADNRVHFIPFVSSKEELYRLIRSSVFFVFPSRFEAMSVMLLEVAMLGTPLISSDIPANVTILPERALYFRSEDAQDLERKIRWALANPQQMKAIAERAQQWVSEKYDWGPIVKEYEMLYTQLVEKKKRSPGDGQANKGR